MMAVPTHHTHSAIGRNLFGLGPAAKAGDRPLADLNYEGTAAADTALGPRFNRAGEEAKQRPTSVSS
jgi:hypothetical protein